MKKITFILILFLNTAIVLSQNTEHQSESEKAYIALMNYIPKGLSIDDSEKPNSRFLKNKIKTIWYLKGYYEL